jgi:HEAT repeat protein
MSARERRRAVIIAGHGGDTATAAAHLDDPDPAVRAAAIGALDRLGELTAIQVTAGFADIAAEVRRRAAELAGTRVGISLLALLDDDDPTVIEVAAWACGEQEHVGDDVLDRLIGLATGSDEPLVREAAAAALGAIGDERGLPAILAACVDKPNVRRRAVLALAPFEGPEVVPAIEHALADRDWQVRQADEDLRRASGELDLG